MARLSKADWNKLKQSTAPYKGALIRGVKWNPSKDRAKWLKKVKAQAVKPESGGDDG